MKSLFVVILFPLLTSTAWTQTVHSIGVAKNERGQTVYVERHVSSIKNGQLARLETEYFATAEDKKSFGYINSDFSRNPFIPEFKFADHRLGRHTSVQWKNQKVLTEARPKRGEELRQATFDNTQKMVAGQGFYNMILTHSDQFKDPKFRKKVRLLVPLKESWYTFRLRHKSYDPKLNEIVIRLEANSWFFRLFAPKIDVTMNLTTKRLVRYQGPSNILSSEGKVVDVTIEYSYPQTTAVL